MDRIEAMRVFIAVADSRGFAPAARRLRLSPSAVTRFVAALEEQLGTRLLQRTTRSVALTDAGARYLERAKRILSDVADAEAAARAERGVPAGRLVVSAPSVFGRLHVAPLLSDFLARYPDVRGELSLLDRVTNLVDEGIDAAVRIGPLDDAGYVTRQVGSVRRVVVASPRYLAKHKRPRTPADLSRHDVIQFTALNPTREWRFRVGNRDVNVPVAARFVTNSADAALIQAEGRGGLAMVLSYQVLDAVRAGRLEIVLDSFEPPPWPIHIAYPSTRLLSATVRAFIDFVAETRDWRFLAT